MAYIGAGITRFNTADELTVTGDAEFDTNTLVINSTNNSVGIGTSSPDFPLHMEFSGNGTAHFKLENTDDTASGYLGSTSDNLYLTAGGQFNGSSWEADDATYCIGALQINSDTSTNGSSIFFRTTDTADSSPTERMRIDSSGNLLVGKTSADIDTVGVEARANGRLSATMDGDIPLDLNRKTSDGPTLILRQNGTIIGEIGCDTGGNDFLVVGQDTVGFGFIPASVSSPDRIIPRAFSGSPHDGNIDLGDSGSRFQDIFATNGTIQTSDRNEKQDIEELSEAEQRVAVAAKGLLRKFRWKSAVDKKDNNPDSDETARIHFGIIAQDLQAAFEAEGLDAGRYAMFIHSEWWETYTDVPAVEAQDAVYETQTDEEGNETQVLVSEAVEAKEAYTRTDTYDTEEEAPEGAVKKSRMGVRYSELLAFIIAAL